VADRKSAQDKVEQAVEDKVEQAVEDKVEQAVEDKVERAVEDKVERKVERKVRKRVAKKVDQELDERLDERSEELAGVAARTERAASKASKAAAGASAARKGAVAAGEAAVEAATEIAPDDPLLDTAARKIEAQVDEENPFGKPGRPLSRRSPFRLGFTAALGVALAYGLVNALIAVRSVLILILISAFLAIGLNPAVEAFERRGLRRTYAVGIVLVAVILFFVGFGFAVVPPIIDQGTQLAHHAPDYVRQLQENRRIASLDDKYHFLQRLKTYVDKPERLGGALFGGVLGAGKVVLNAFFQAITVLVLTLYLMANLPDIKAGAYRMVPRSRRARVGLLADEILERVGGYVAGNLLISLIAGSLTYVVLLILGVPYALGLALLVAVTDLVPVVGATLGAAVVTTVGLFVSVKTGLIAAGYYLAYQQVENYVLYPRIMKRSVDVSPIATVIAVLIGGSLMGILGALLAIPVAAAVQLVVQEVAVPRQDEA
jgi:predicted PurR-regulated permease PerM